MRLWESNGCQSVYQLLARKFHEKPGDQGKMWGIHEISGLNMSGSIVIEYVVLLKFVSSSAEAGLNGIGDSTDSHRYIFRQTTK